MKCSHISPGLWMHAPLTCHGCGGWIAEDGTVMDRQTTLRRYPQFARYIVRDTCPPDRRQPGVGRMGVELGVEAFKAAYQVVASLFALAVLVFVVVALLH